MNQELTILVVDDDPDIRLATARVLRKAGYRVEAAETGEQCLQMVSEKSPDLVLLDVILPDIDGYEVCRRIKADAKRAGTYVLLLSGKKTASDDQSQGLEIGADGYIARPIPNRELLARTQAMARIIRAERERDRAIEELNAAMASIKTLKGLLPICASCKKIRDDKGYWNQVESYISTHSEVQFSHSVCPECVKKLYPDYYEDIFPEGNRGKNKIEK
ncbi:MAG: response regulator transcription factor [Desulfobacteraceae bacterium]